MKKIKIPKKIRQFFKKLITIETYEDLLVDFLKFFIKRNPASPVYALTKIISPKLNFGVPRSSTSEKTFSKSFSEHCQYFSSHHPYISAGTSFVLIVSIITGTFGFLFFRNTESTAAWWDDTWGYRKAIQISNSNGQDLTDFQVAVTIDTATLISEGKLQSQCQDLRFTDTNGSLLPFWIEEDNPGCNNSATKVWLKIPTVYDGTNATMIYAYYGKASASDKQNGDEVFEFFDDFEDANQSTENWEQAFEGGVDGSWLISNGHAQLQNGSGGNAAISLANYSNDNDYIVEAKTQHVSSPGDSMGLIARGSNNGTYYHQEIDQSSLYLYRFDNWSYSSLDNNSVSVSADVWYTTRLKVLGTSISAYSYTHNTSVSATDSDIASGKPGVQVYNQTARFDDFRVRKAVSTDPTAGTPGSEEKSKGPVGYWSFDEGYGTMANDGSGKGNNGTITGATWQTEDQCVAGKCLWFDGGDSVSISNPFNQENVAQEWSVTAWVRIKKDDIDGSQRLVDGMNNDLYVNFSSSDKPLLYLNGGDDDYYIYGTTDLKDGQWHQITFLFRNSDGYRKIYIDGKDDSSAGPNRTSTPSGIDSTLYIGKYLKGYIDEVKFYPYLRSIDEVKKDYNAGLAAMSTPKGSSVAIGSNSPKWMSDGLVGYWKMDEVSGTTVVDASGNGNDGTLTNAQETGTGESDGTTTTLVDSDNASLSSTDDSYNDMILRITGGTGCGISTGIERLISDYTGSTKTITVGNVFSAETDNCEFEIRHQTGGRFGNATNFDGINDYLDVGQNVKYTDGVTYSAWIKPDIIGTYDHIIRKDCDTIKLYSATGNIEFTLDGTDWNGHRSTGVVSPGVWTLVTGTYDKATKSLKYYINGEHDSTHYYDVPLSDGASTSSMYIGENSYPGQQGVHLFDGNIDEVRIYNRALSPQEIKDLYEWAPGPIGHWKMDEGSGTGSEIIKDISGNDNHGNMEASMTEDDWIQGKYGNALDFDGSNDSLDFGNKDLFNFGFRDFTLEAWIKMRESQEHFAAIFYKQNYGAGTGYRFVTKANGGLAFNMGDGSHSVFYSSRTGLNDNSWHHVSVSANRSGYLNFFIDGVLDSQHDISSIENINSVQNLYIGGKWNWFNGAIDDARIYDYARTEKQIKEDMLGSDKATSGGNKSGSEGSQIACWKFDEGYGTTVYDSVGGNDGTISGASWTNEGRFGKALSFDGVDDYISVSNTDFYESFSLSAWVNINSNPTYSYESYFSLSGGSVLRFSMEDDSLKNSVRWKFPDGSYDTYYLSDNNSLDTWVNFTTTYDGSTNILRGYKNGILEYTYVDVDIYEDFGGGYYIGKNLANDEYFSGKIDEVKIYNYALSESEIKKDYNQGKGLVMGSKGTESDGKTPSQSSSREYCIPGDTATCNPPVAEWKFDEMSGATAYDTSGNGNNGTLNGNPSWTGLGKVGSALEFDGDNDYLEMGDVLDMETDDMTISLWIKTGYHETRTYLLSKSRATAQDYRYGVSLDSTGFGRIFMQGDGGSDFTLNGSVFIADGNWHNVNFVFDRDGEAKIYVDGKYDNGGSIAHWSGANMNSNNPFRIGVYTTSDNSGISAPFNGLIDDVKIYKYARTPAQIAWDYNRGKPIAHWKMDEGEGTTVHDESGNGNHGTMTNMSSDDWVDGKNNGALDFDGNNDYVSLSHSDNLNASDSVSISSWIKTSNTGRMTIVTKHYNDYELAVDDPNVSVWYGDGNSWNDLGWSGFSADGQWHNVIVVIDKKNGSGKAWVDGKYLGEDTDDPGSGNKNDPFYIGSRLGTGQFFDGQIDDVQVYNYALTPLQIKQVYNNGAVNYK